MKIEDIAKVAHKINKSYCMTFANVSEVTWEDIPSWKDVPRWQRSIRLAGVIYCLENNKATPQDVHNNWLKEMKAVGWKFGLIEDSNKKQHPCMVPFYQLFPEQKAQDFIFKAVVDSLKEFVELGP